MKYQYLAAAVISSLLFTTSCKLIDPKEEVPAYVRIDSIPFQVNDATQGTNNQNITEAWVFVDDLLQGVYTLPCEVPILKFGDHEIKVRGGIKRNTNSFSRVDYPFFTTYATKVNLASLKTDTIRPLVRYFTDALIWNEGFEDAGVKLIKSEGADTGIVSVNAPAVNVFEGYGSGKLAIDNTRKIARVRSNGKFKFPLGEPVFAEINFKGNNRILVGLIVHNGSTGGDVMVPYLFLKASDTWKKAYVNLSEVINENINVPSYDVYFELEADVDNPVTDPHMLIDNVKILYPKK